MTDWFFNGDYGLVPTNWASAALGLLLAFGCGHVIAWVYMFTYAGLSYSRSFVNSLIIMPMMVALTMTVLSNNLVTAFGMMAVFGIVRFRNVLRDTLDTAYVLIVIVIGMASGTQKFASAILGCCFASCAMLYFWYTSFGSRLRYDVIVNLHWDRPQAELAELRRLLDRHSRTALCASQRSQPGSAGTDFSYRLVLRDSGRADELLSELRETAGVSRVTSMRAEDESEL